jgi:hypothetical protein
VELDRITDMDLVRKLITHPSVYPLLTDDYSPPAEKFQVNAHPGIWYVGVMNDEMLVGLFCLYPVNTVCWDVHVVMYPWAKSDEKWEAARRLPPWLADHTSCRRLTGWVPESRRQVIYYAAQGLQMHYVGRQEKAIMRGGRLEDLILFGRSVEVSNA